MARQIGLVPFGLALAMCLSSQLYAGAGGAGRPFKGAVQGELTGIAPSGALIVESSGSATHLGNFTRTEYVFVNGASISGTVVFTAANGDELWASFTGAFISPTQAEGTYTFTGGTGRFTDATGTASFQSTTSTTPDGVTHVAVTFDGAISY